MTRMGPKPGTVYKRPPHDIITERGAVGVLLSNRPARVWVDQAHFDRIVKAHGNRAWAWIEASRYVKLNVGHIASVSVARLVVGEGGYFVRYHDGDRLNLRRANLSTEEPVRPSASVKREKPKEGLVYTPRTPKAPKAAASRSVVTPRMKTPSEPRTPFLQAMECRPKVPPPPSAATVMLSKRSTQIVSTVKRQRNSPP
jgi:hypothetical protein